MSESLVTVLYLLSGALFILSLGGLSAQETASRGNRFGVLGMLIAIATTAFGAHVSGSGYLVLALCVAVGSGIGAVLAARVEMTAMPELVAILHSFVGLAAVLDSLQTANELMSLPSRPAGGRAAGMASVPPFDVRVVGVRRRVYTSKGLKVPVRTIGGGRAEWVIVQAVG